MINGIAAIIFSVRDLEQACEFYTRVLGMPPRYKHKKSGWAEFTVGNIRFAVQQAPPFGKGTNPRISLLVERLESTVANLKADGVRFKDEIIYEYFGKMIDFEDPDGNVITLFEPANP